MGNLFRDIRDYPKREGKGLGFVKDKNSEGFFKKLDYNPDSSVNFIIHGSWSYVNIYCGLGFKSLNEYIYKKSIESGWNSLRASIFKLDLMSMFSYSLGDYCESDVDIGIYCPIGSNVHKYDEIIEIINIEYRKISKIHEIESALIYMISNKLYNEFSYFFIPAAAKICSRYDILSSFIGDILPNLPKINKIEDRNLLDALVGH